MKRRGKAGGTDRFAARLMVAWRGSSLSAGARTLRTIVLAILAAALLAPAAWAQAPARSPSPEFSRYLASDGHRAGVIAAAQRTNTLLPGSCAAAAFRWTGLVSVQRPPRFDAGGQPIDGMWSEPVIATGCGVTRRLNVLTLAAPDKPPRQVGLLPGTTHADPLLQRDGLHYAFLGATLLAKDCKRIIVTDTRFDDYEAPPAADAQPGRQPRPWRETWTLWACGTAIDMPIHFVPDATGTGIHVAPSEAQLRR